MHNCGPGRAGLNVVHCIKTEPRKMASLIVGKITGVFIFRRGWWIIPSVLSGSWLWYKIGSVLLN